MHVSYSIVVYGCLYFCHAIHAAFTPCNGKALLNEDCDITADCEHKASICLRGKCRCHFHYVGRRTEKVPARIGDICSGKCREPLFCRNGQCQCVQRGNTKIVNGECVLVNRVGDRCTRHYDCTAPFTACVKRVCSCISGTIVNGPQCIAAIHCPIGGISKGDCTRRAQYQETVENLINSGGQADDCPLGYYCVTPSDSPLGHCCPAACPLASTPDSRYSCESLAPESQQCPGDTHYCHRVSGPGYAFAVCCRRPCNSVGPEAIFVHGECLARGHLNSKCIRNEQCDGTQTMLCSKAGRCQCKSGFTASQDTLTHPDRNPSQTCRRNCIDKRLARDNICFSKVALNEKCFIQSQCPSNSGCYRGRCLCRCGFKHHNGQCRRIPSPSTTTAEPGSVVRPTSGKDFLGILGKLLNGQGGGNIADLFRG